MCRGQLRWRTARLLEIPMKRGCDPSLAGHTTVAAVHHATPRHPARDPWRPICPASTGRDGHEGVALVHHGTRFRDPDETSRRHAPPPHRLTRRQLSRGTVTLRSP